MSSRVHSTDPLAGTRYRALRLLGAGGSGEVYVVEHLELGKKFVAKVLHERHTHVDSRVERLRREARVLGQLRHPNIVEVIDFELASDGRPFIVMEYLEGRTLAEELARRGRLDQVEAIAFGRQLLSALGAAHAQGVVHRDIKPQNLFVQQRSAAAPVLRVLDFGASRDLGGRFELKSSTVLTTSTGAILGTLGYMSPEAATGQPVDARTDIYSAAVVLVVMLSGRLPLEGRLHAIGSALRASDLDLPHEVNAATRAAIFRGLAFQPAERFQSAAEFFAALAAT